ncbi:unnamed protein product [Eruca vesicaria subsp. sativa]|uniref:Uncharacterized protein n=1 Tax=Eruca vesicaria subsp. sativa TaxID=29727 RepID=A0ABC8JB93_ERUVS|nr:unnamed protein product [Eruca vesicaria subsp. sativa]
MFMFFHFSDLLCRCRLSVTLIADSSLSSFVHHLRSPFFVLRSPFSVRRFNSRCCYVLILRSFFLLIYVFSAATNSETQRLSFSKSKLSSSSEFQGDLRVSKTISGFVLPFPCFGCKIKWNGTVEMRWLMRDGTADTVDRFSFRRVVHERRHLGPDGFSGFTALSNGDPLRDSTKEEEYGVFPVMERRRKRSGVERIDEADDEIYNCNSEKIHIANRLKA